MIYLTGRTGYIGSNLALWLDARGIEFSAIEGDVTDPGFADGVEFAAGDAVYHLAGVTGVDRSFESPEDFCAVNVVGLINLCRAVSACRSGMPRIVFPSSRLVYRGGLKMDEGSALEAKSIYAANKISGEAVLSAYHHMFDIPYVALRIGQLYGNNAPDVRPNGVYSSFERQAKEGGPVTVYGDGMSFRTWTHIDDLCHVMHRAAHVDIPSGPYNVGGSDATVLSVAMDIADRHHVCLRHVDWPVWSKKADTGDATLDGSLLQAKTGGCFRNVISKCNYEERDLHEEASMESV